MKELFDQVSIRTSRNVTRTYSTSFSLGIRFLSPRMRNPVHAIYGFVRLADEIVDSFHSFNRRILLERFTADTWLAIREGISLNPVLNSFQQTVNQYQIDHKLIHTFLHSMEMDLSDQRYTPETYEEYILGSAEVVGLMCLKIFVDGNEERYQELQPSAMKLGSAFQKVNFLRDFKADTEQLGRRYFPQLQNQTFNAAIKAEIEADIESDFATGLEGIKQLPADARFGVYVAYIYYRNLLRKITETTPHGIMQERIRVSGQKKISLLFSSYLRHSLNLL
ncbi:MAG: phytoene/squalene synthase family protein [Bacteroidia bacterium]|jgi:phytoene/squalene synthetase